MKPELTLAEAKDMSLTKWRGIKAALPHVSILTSFRGQPDEEVYGECGFCQYCGRYDGEDCGKEGEKCVLYPKYCTNYYSHSRPALYWRICNELEKGEDASEDIDKMIAAIEAVEV